MKERAKGLAKGRTDEINKNELQNKKDTSIFNVPYHICVFLSDTLTKCSFPFMFNNPYN